MQAWSRHNSVLFDEHTSPAAVSIHRAIVDLFRNTLAQFWYSIDHVGFVQSLGRIDLHSTLSSSRFIEIKKITLGLEILLKTDTHFGPILVPNWRVLKLSTHLLCHIIFIKYGCKVWFIVSENFPTQTYKLVSPIKFYQFIKIMWHKW